MHRICSYREIVLRSVECPIAIAKKHIYPRPDCIDLHYIDLPVTI